jgi:hypothetical protein
MALHASVPKERRCDPIKGGSLVQADEGVGVEPVSADAVTTVHQGNTHVGVVDQRICKRHTGGTGTNDQIVGFDGAPHAPTQARRWRTGLGPGRGPYDQGLAEAAPKACLSHAFVRVLMNNGSPEFLGDAPIQSATPRRYSPAAGSPGCSARSGNRKALPCRPIGRRPLLPKT